MIGVGQQQRISNTDLAAEEIVLIHESPLWRDCFAGCLEFESYAVLQFATPSSWLNARSNYPPPSVAVVCEPNQKEMALVVRIAMETATIVVLGSASRSNVCQLLSEGVRGIIPADTTFNVALNAIRLVESGGTFVPVDVLSQREGRVEFGDILTGRQLEVVEALRQGKANKQIAHELKLSESTVKVHIRKIMRKLDARNRTEIAVLANELISIGRDSKSQL